MEFLISSPDLKYLSYHTGTTNCVSWDDVYTDLVNHVPNIKNHISEHEHFGIGLQLSYHMINELSNPSAFAELRSFLSQNQCYLYTVDGFNKALFDWKDAKLLNYHNRLANLLSKWLPPHITGCISTVPGTPKQFVNNKSDIKYIAQHWIAHAEYLVRLERETGKQITLAIKPEAESFLETTQQSIDFLNQQVFSTQACTELSSRLNVNQQDAEDLLRTHITLCLDVAETPIEYTSFDAYTKSVESQGVSVGKKQISADTANTSDLNKQIANEVYEIMQRLDTKGNWIDAKRAA